MNILLVTQDFPPKLGGIETYSYQLAKNWSAQGHKVIVLTVSIKKSRQLEQQFDAKQDYTVIRLKTSDPIYLALLIKPKLKDLIKEYAIDSIFHAQWHHAVKSCKMLDKGELKNVYVAIHGRELAYNPYQNIPLISSKYRSKMRYVFNHCSHIFSNSHFTAQKMFDCCTETDLASKTTVTSLGYDPDIFKDISRNQALKSLNLDQSIGERVIILNLARLIHRKGADLTLRALSIIKKRTTNHSFAFLIAGNGPFLSELKTLVQQHNLQNEVYFIGGVAGDEVANLFVLSDIFVMVSRSSENDFEGFGIVYLEAGAFGVPVIGANSGGVPDAIVHGETGYLIEEENVEELADILQMLMQDNSLRDQIGQSAQNWVQNRTWFNVADYISKVIHETYDA